MSFTMSSYSTGLKVAASIIIFLVVKWIMMAFSTRSRLPYPPGPQGYWLIGNARQLPKTLPWITYAKWTELYGGYMLFWIFGRPLLVINSGKVAIELLEKRIYSDRVPSAMASQLVGLQLTALQPYGQRWREHRKLLHRCLNVHDVERHKNIQLQEVHKLMLRLAEDQNGLFDYIKRFTGSIIMLAAYGYELKAKDEYVDAINAFETAVIQIFEVGFLVDLFPILNYLPQWMMPGGGFKQLAQLWRSQINHITELPWSEMMGKYILGQARESFCTSLLDEHGGIRCDAVMQRLIKETSSTMYSGGSETTSAALSSFFLVMTLYPDIQRKAQEEIDQVVGHERLPTFDDRQKLPFVECILREIYRWATPSNMGVTHRLMEDDVYEGYFIPAGTAILTNIWAMLHDAEVYPDPMSFNPERFANLSKEESKAVDPRNFMFGFGRRICVGALFADNALFIAIASILACFNIGKRVVDGKEMVPVVEYKQYIGRPSPFKCAVAIRSEAARGLITAAVEAEV